ncbi:MAG: ABC transporter permease [Planctomycetes bacterium]|nr:ABC transporter permease [Planctomycetota bacterium]
MAEATRADRVVVRGFSSLGGFARRTGTELSLLAAVAAVVALTAVLDDAYRTKPAQNAHEILRQTSLLGIFALGAATVIISGGIDLSSGSVIAFSSAVCASIIFMLAPVDEFGNPITRDLSGWILAAAVGGTLLVGVLIGTFHAWLVTCVGLPPFVATLASLVGLRSFARVLIQDVTAAFSQQGRNTQIYIDDAAFGTWGKDWAITLAIFLAVAAVMWLLLSGTVTGRHLYAMGGNERAARLSGIRTERLKWLAYCTGSVTASIAGILYCSYIGMANPASQGVGQELNAIAAAVVGGCSLTGGVGTVAGVMLGALFLQVVIDSVAKTVKSHPDELQGLIVGMLVVLAVAFNELRDRGLVRKRFFPGALGTANVFILSLLAGTITSVMVESEKLRTGVIVGTIALVLLAAKKILELWARRR